MNWDKTFPKLSSRIFLSRVEKNWRALENGELDKKGNDVALRLYHEFKPAKGKINKITMLFLWIYLCINRPWERDWKVSLDESQGENTWDKIYDVLDQLNISFPDNIQFQTLRKYANRKNFKAVIVWVSADPGLSSIIGSVFAEGARAFQKMKKRFRNQIDYENLKLIFKFTNFVNTQKFIRKRDLMRKLAINKKTCDLLLAEAVSQNFIKLLEATQKTVWIIHTSK